jgi:hypothetical protein
MEPWYIARCNPQRDGRFDEQIQVMGLTTYRPVELEYTARSRHTSEKVPHWVSVTPRLVFVQGPYWQVWQIEALWDFDSFVRGENNQPYAIPDAQIRAFRAVIDERNTRVQTVELRRLAKIMAKPNKPRWYKMGGAEMVAAMQAMVAA